MPRKKQSRFNTASGRRGIIDYSTTKVSQRAQDCAERSRREADKANQITRDYTLGRREGQYDGSGGSRIMPLISEE